MYYSWSRQSSAWTSCEWDELYLTSSGTDGLNIVEIFLLNERFPNSASVYFQHFLCPVLLAATSAKKHCEYKLQPKTLKNLWLLHSWGAGAVTVLANCCKTLQVTAAKLKQAPFHSWKVDLFHPGAAPGHRMRHFRKQSRTEDIRDSSSLFLC